MSLDAFIDGLQNQLPKSIPSPKTNPTSNAVGTDFQAMVEEQQKMKEEILEKGFGTYVQEQQQEKLEEEIKQKILDALGLTEEQFNALPAKQKAAIEQAIKEAVEAEMMNRTQENQEQKIREGTGKPASLSVPMVVGLSL